jgi:inosose dehydratase
VAAGPISWGVCEVPGWGPQLPPDRVLAEIHALGIRLVEAGPLGYLGSDAASIRAVLERYSLSLVGGFVPVVLHDPAGLDDTLASARAAARLYAQAGGRVLVSAGVADLEWSQPFELDASARRTFCVGLARLDDVAAAEGLQHVFHPHAGTLVETAEQVLRVLDGSEVRLCLDTGHLTIGGADPAALAADVPERIGHVHLKDVRSRPMDQLRAGRLTLLEATRRGLFAPLGDGEGRIADTVQALERHGYEGWYVLEQDAILTGDATAAAGTRPAADARRSIEFLRSVIGTERSPQQKEALA